MVNYNAILAYTGICGIAPVYATVSTAVTIATLPLPSRVGEWADEWLYYSFQTMMRLYFELYPRTKFLFHGDRPADENCLYMSNHQSNMDWFIPVILSSDVSAAGRVRYVLKDTLRLLPLFGWNFANHGAIYVSKGGGFNQVQLVQSLDVLATRLQRLWLIIFPEGTRHTPVHDLSTALKGGAAADAAGSGHDSSQQRGLVMVAPPRSKAFVASLQQLWGCVDAVYDVTIAYNVGQGVTKRPEYCTMETMMGGGFAEVHVHLRRVEMADIPVTTHEQEHWLRDAFATKDEILTSFYAGEGMPGPKWENRSAAASTFCCAAFWHSLLALSLGTRTGRRIYFGQLLIGGLGGMVVGGSIIMYHRRKQKPAQRSRRSP